MCQHHVVTASGLMDVRHACEWCAQLQSTGRPLSERSMRRAVSPLLIVRVVALTCCTVAQPAFAQDSATRPMVILQVRTPEGEPIRGASITYGEDSRVSRTDALGEVRLPTRELRRNIRIRAVGYAPLDTALRWTGDTAVLTLRTLAVRLDSIVVTANGVSKPLRYAKTTKFDTFYERRATAIGGKFFTREDIEQSNSSSVYDLVRKVPGTKIERDQTGGAVVRFERCVGNANPLTGRATESAFDGTSKVVQVYVDGLKTSEPYMTLQNIKPENVEAMEVYQGVAQLPVDARGNGCAAIYIWTRYSVGSVLPAKH